MGIFSSIKKLFFAGESVAKSAVDKTTEFVKDKATEAADKVKDFADNANISERTTGLKDAIMDTASKGFEAAKDLAEEAVEKTKEVATDLSAKVEAGMDQLAENEHVKKAMDFTEKVGDKVLDAGETFVEKAKTVTESIGAKVIEEGSEFTEKAKSFSETVGEKVLSAKDVLVDKAKEASQVIEEKFEELTDKALKSEAEDAAKPKQEFSDKTLDAGGSLLDDKDDFFSKAAKYAEGKYDAFADKVSDKIDEIKKDLPSLDLPSDDSNTDTKA